MREIKFRAWSDKFDKMIYLEDKEYSIDVHARTIWKDSIDDECPTLMQYTGLKDKNGKEIYEGDILRLTEDVYEVTVNEFTQEWVIDNDGGMSNLGTTYKECVVIGNIYENPELLGEIDE